MDHLVMSPLRILRRLESDRLKTAPSPPEAAMDDETVVITREEDRIDEDKPDAAVWEILTARLEEIRVALDEAEAELEMELECSSLGRLTLLTKTVEFSEESRFDCPRRVG